MLQDIAVLTGGQVISEEVGLSLEKATLFRFLVDPIDAALDVGFLPWPSTIVASPFETCTFGFAEIIERGLLSDRPISSEMTWPRSEPRCPGAWLCDDHRARP